MLEFGIGERKETFRAGGDGKNNAGKGVKGRKNRITLGKFVRKKETPMVPFATMSAPCVVGNI